MPALQAGTLLPELKCLHRGRQDLNLRPLGPQPADAGAICVRTRPICPLHPRLGTHRTDWTMRPVPKRYHASVVGARSGPIRLSLPPADSQANAAPPGPVKPPHETAAANTEQRKVVPFV
jgi:hypothetical protein